MRDRSQARSVKNEVEPGEIGVELRLSDQALERRILEWLDLDQSGRFVQGPVRGRPSVTIADHIPDDTTGPIILLASDDELASWPRDSRVMARLTLNVGWVKLRIAVEAAAHGLSIREALPASETLAPEASTLSNRELEVLQQLAMGASNKAIARALDISSHTVKFHVAAVLEKLGVSSRTEAAIYAIRQGLILI